MPQVVPTEWLLAVRNQNQRYEDRVGFPGYECRMAFPGWFRHLSAVSVCIGDCLRFYLIRRLGGYRKGFHEFMPLCHLSRIRLRHLKSAKSE